MSDYGEMLHLKFDQLGLASILSFEQFKALDKIHSMMVRQGDFVPTPIEDIILLMHSLDQTRNGGIFVDLGSGPGMIQLCASFFHFRAVGIEKDPNLAGAYFERMKTEYQRLIGETDARSICASFENEDPSILEVLGQGAYIYAYHWPKDLPSVFGTYKKNCPNNAQLILRVQDNMRQQYLSSTTNYGLTVVQTIRSLSHQSEFLVCSK